VFGQCLDPRPPRLLSLLAGGDGPAIDLKAAVLSGAVTVQSGPTEPSKVTDLVILAGMTAGRPCDALDTLGIEISFIGIDTLAVFHQLERGWQIIVFLDRPERSWTGD
jgi:hypothetical protein